MFGVNSPLRVLRKKWSNATQLAEELYAMFTSRAPVEHEGPVTIRVGHGETGLRIVQDDPDRPGVPSLTPPRRTDSGLPPTPFEATPPAARKRARQQAESLRADQSRVAATDAYQFSTPLEVATTPPSPAWDPTVAYRMPAFEVDGPTAFRGPAAVQFDKPPLLFNLADGTYHPIGAFAPPKLPIAPDNSTDGGSFGKVVSGSGDTYQVTLYPDGPDGEEGDTVSVKILMIADGETIKPETWIGPVLSDSDGENHFGLVPVWME